MKSGLLSAILLSLVLALALAFASSLEPTAPGMILIALVPVLLSGTRAVTQEKRSPFFALVVFSVCGYVVWRAVTSPVEDFGRTDLLLLCCGGTGCFWAGWLVDRRAHKWVVGGLGLLALVNLAVALIQLKNPAFTPFYAGRTTKIYPSGLYGHYNHFANFMLAVGFLAAAGALLGRGARSMRLMWSGLTVACGVGVVLSQSRGAFVAAAVGLLALLICWLLDLKRRRVTWFGVALVSVITLLPLLGFGGWWATRQLLAKRGVAENASRFLDDSGRLKFASSALSIIGEQPPDGGGSRSFSYEVFRYWKAQKLWGGSGDIDFVHNEFLQAGTDYGWIGLAALMTLLALVTLRALIVLVIEPEKGGREPDGAMTAGALAAIAAMSVQSLFSFVFHMAPDVLVLGILIGIIASQPWPFGRLTPPPMLWKQPALWASMVMAMGLMLLGWRDAAAWWIAARPDSDGLSPILETRYDAIQEALVIRPDFRLERDSAEIADRLAREEKGTTAEVWEDRSFQHLQATGARNPKDYANRLNLARMLDRFGQFTEAFKHYQVLLPLLDQREYHYRARFTYGSHAFRRADALFKARRPTEALAWALESQKQMAISNKLCWIRPDGSDAAEIKKLNEFVKFLQDAHYTPEPDVVTPIEPN